MRKRRLIGALACNFLIAGIFVGCERKERVVDVKTPSTEVHVDRNLDTGNVQVDTVKKK
jgi:hypothetical protein